MDNAAPLAAWQTYYTVLGTSAATLIGLTFVVITLVATLQREASSLGVSVFTTPNVVHFATALVGSLLLCAPWHGVAGPALSIIIVSIAGLAISLRAASLSRKMDSYSPDREDWVWYSILPICTYIIMFLSALLLWFKVAESTYVVASIMAFVIVMGIRNSWDVVTYITVREKDEEA